MGGIQNVIKNIGKCLAKEGHIVKIICLTNKESLPNYENIDDIDVYRIKDKFYLHLMTYSINFNNFLKINKKLFDEADIISVYGYHTPFSLQAIMLLHSQGYSDKIVFIPNYAGIGSTFIKNILLKCYKYIGKSGFTMSKKIACVSEYERNKIIKDFNIDKNKIVLIPNGIRFSVPEKIIKIKSQKNKLNLLYVGRIEKQKGIHFVLKAIPVLKEKYSLNVKFNIVGNGNYINGLVKIINRYKLENDVNFLGVKFGDELEKLYIDSDILFLLSKFETYGLVVAEALVHGSLVIVSNNTALAEFTRESGCFGIDYPPNEYELANLIYRLISEKIELGPFNKNKIRNWDIASKEFELMYNDLLV